MRTSSGAFDLFLSFAITLDADNHRQWSPSPTRNVIPETLNIFADFQNYNHKCLFPSSFSHHVYINILNNAPFQLQSKELYILIAALLTLKITI